MINKNCVDKKVNENILRYDNKSMTNENIHEANYSFQKLTPINTVDLTVYEHAFEYIFNNKDIKNVAISGAYGAGKSSVLESYKSVHKEINFINISLASFDPELTDEQNENIAKNLNKENILEGKILNQLLHQISTKNIPRTNFKVKGKITNKEINLTVISIFLFLLFSLHIFNYSSWHSYIKKLIKLSTNNILENILEFLGNPYLLFVSGIGIGIIFISFLRKLVSTQKNNTPIKKLNIKGNEIEVLGCDDNSYFDKYLNEVLYI